MRRSSLISLSGNSSSGSSKIWLQRHKKDVYVKMSVAQDLRSRAVFKLDEIQEKYRLITPSSIVLDLGAAPGGWSLSASKIVKNELGGHVFAIDLLPFKKIEGVTTLQGDFCTSEMKIKLKTLLNGRSVDVILSDMLHNTSGDKSRDHAKSMDLMNDALDFSIEVLKKNGSFLGKYLRGSDEKELIERVSVLFESHKIVKPKASRQESSEIYLLCQRKK